MSDPNDHRKRSPSLGQKIITKVKKTVRSLSGNSERRPKFDQQEPSESLAERLHREKLERDQAARNRSNTESFLQSGRNGPRVVQTRNGPRAVQEPTRSPPPQQNRLEREAARWAGTRPASPPRGRSPTARRRRPGTTVRASSPRHRRPAVTGTVSRPEATVRFKSPTRGAPSFRPGSPPRNGPSPLAVVSTPPGRPHANSLTKEVSGKGSRNVNNPGHLHPDRFTPEAWPTPNTGVYGPQTIPGARAPAPDLDARAPAPNTGVKAIYPVPAPNTTVQAIRRVPGHPNLAAEGLHGIAGLPTTRKPFPAVIQRAAASDDLRGPGIVGSRHVEPGLAFRPISACVSLVSPTPTPEDLDSESPGTSLQTEASERSGESYLSDSDTGYIRIVADRAPVLRTPTILQHDNRHSRFSGRALAHMHVHLCENCHSRPRSERSRHLCRSCEHLPAGGDSPSVSPLSPRHTAVPQNTPVSPVTPPPRSGSLLCPRCRRSPLTIRGAHFCRACERQLGYEHVTPSPRRRRSRDWAADSPTLGSSSPSPYSSAPRRAPNSGASPRPKNPPRAEAPIRHDFAVTSTLRGPFSPDIPILPAVGPVPAQKRKGTSRSGPTPPLKDSAYLRANPQLTARHHQNVSVPFPKLVAAAAQHPAYRTRGPADSEGNLSLSAFLPPCGSALAAEGG
ncbi:hypothetical protein MMC27_001234, partial [Xylographa pallens]|nr:hypothetical protein [Xylographa pallens]